MVHGGCARLLRCVVSSGTTNRSVPRDQDGGGNAPRKCSERSGHGLNGKMALGGVPMSPGRPTEPIPGSRSLCHHGGPSSKIFKAAWVKVASKRPRRPLRPAYEASSPSSRARGSSAQLPGSPWAPSALQARPAGRAARGGRRTTKRTPPPRLRSIIAVESRPRTLAQLQALP